MEIHVYRLDAKRIRVLINGDGYKQLFSNNISIPLSGNPLTDILTALIEAFAEVEKGGKYK